MTDIDEKAFLLRYLQRERDTVVWKLDGLSEYDVRRPMTPTGTNLLGLVKHLACVEFGYFADSVGRPHGESIPWWSDDAEPNADLWATVEESRESVIAFYRRAWAFSDATFDALSLDAVARVRWWPAEHAETSLRRLAVHVLDETARHAGHADIVRELIDGAAGLRAASSNLDPPTGGWPAYVQHLEQVAREAAERAGENVPTPGA